MATKIIAKKSSVAAKVPLTTDLEIGEIAVNLTDKKLYTKQADGTVVHVLPDIVPADAIQFDTTSALTSSPGRLTWNDGDGTLDLGLKGGNVTLQLGQEIVVLCYNASGATLTDGQVVYVTGAQGQRPSVELAVNSSEANSSKTIGLVTETIAAGATGFITIQGIVHDLNTSAYAEGTALWLSSTPGAYTSTKPTAPANSVAIGWVLRSHSTSGSVFVNIQNGYELEELHNVLVTTPSNGQVLAYESATGLWKNSTPSGGGVTDGDKGDIIVSGSGTSWTLDPTATPTLDSLTTTTGVIAPVLTNSGNLIIDAAGSSAVQIATNSVEHFRIASTGAFGLDGGNYGIEGEVLTSEGSAQTPTWRNATYWIRTSNGGYNLASTTAYQKLFNSPTNGSLLLPVGVYYYKTSFSVATMSATTGNLGFSVLGAGTAVLSGAKNHAIGGDIANSTAGAAGHSHWTGANSAASVVTAGTATGVGVTASGLFAVATQGTIIPSVALVTAVGTCVVTVSSYFIITRLDASTANASFGPWS